jgi:hypothetical protein
VYSVVCHNLGVLDHVSRFAWRCQVLIVSFRDRPRSCRVSPEERLSVRRTSALRQLPPEATGHSPPTSRATAPQTELLLRSRWLSEEDDTTVGTLSRPEGVLERHHHRDQRHAARANTTSYPGTFHTLRRRSTDHCALAGLLARTLSADTFLEDRTGPFGTACRDPSRAIFPGVGCSPFFGPPEMGVPSANCNN